jgi:hypothetical protein
MKSLEEFQEETVTIFQKLEDFRLGELEAAQRAQIYYLIPAFVAILSIPVYWKTNPIMAFIVLAIAIGIGVQLALGVVGKPAKHYQQNFKKKAGTLLAKTLYPKASYNGQKKIAKKSFTTSELYDGVLDYHGEDYLKGQLPNGCKFQFSKLSVLFDENAKNKHLDFEGLFFEIEMPIDFQSKILVLPNLGKSSLENINDLEKLNLKGLTVDGTLVLGANAYPKFEKDFLAYSQSQEMAYNVLTPRVIEAILAVKEQWKIKPRVSFVNKKIYLALETNYVFFEVKIHESLLDQKKVESFYNDLEVCFSLVENFDLPVDENIEER